MVEPMQGVQKQTDGQQDGQQDGHLTSERLCKSYLPPKCAIAISGIFGNRNGIFKLVMALVT